RQKRRAKGAGDDHRRRAGRHWQTCRFHRSRRRAAAPAAPAGRMRLKLDITKRVPSAALSARVDLCNVAREIRGFPMNLPRIARNGVGRSSPLPASRHGICKTKYVGIPDESREYDNLEPGRRRPYYDAIDGPLFLRPKAAMS